MQEDMVKGCKAKCVERANEYKYKNLGPFFSQGENGPDCAHGTRLVRPRLAGSDSGDETPKLRISVPCHGRRRPEKITSI